MQVGILHFADVNSDIYYIDSVVTESDFLSGSKGMIKVYNKRINDKMIFDHEIGKSIHQASKNTFRLKKELSLDVSTVSDSAIIFEKNISEGGTQVYQSLSFLRRTQYFRIHGFKYINNIEPDDYFTVMVGTCLFGSFGVKAFNEHGKILPFLHEAKNERHDFIFNIVSNPNLSLYEYELTVRSASAIADLLSKSDRNKCLTVYLDMPRIQYYLYILDWFREHRMTSDLALRWFEMVDQRYQQVVDLFKLRLEQELVHLEKKPKCNFVQIDGLSQLELYIKKEMAAGREIDFIECMNLLLNCDDNLWKDSLNILKPETFGDLGSLSYAVAALRPGVSFYNQQPSLCIMINDESEWPILARMHNLKKRLQTLHPGLSARTISIYPVRRFIAIHSQSGVQKSLYKVNVGRYIRTDEGDRDLFDIVDRLYGIN